MAIITLDNREIKRYERDLRAFTKSAIHFANRDSLNDMAKLAQRKSKKLLDKKLILRNKWTQNSVRVRRATQKLIRQQSSSVGAIDQYLERVEFGGVVKSKGLKGVPIPTRSASGEGRGTTPRRRLVRPKNTLRKIRFNRRTGTFKSKKQRNAATIRQAKASGEKYVYLELKTGNRGIFRVMGTKKKPKVEMMWALNKRTIRTPRNAWLRPSALFAAKVGPNIYRKNLRLQVRRFGLFRQR